MGRAGELLKMVWCRETSPAVLFSMWLNSPHSSSWTRKASRGGGFARGGFDAIYAVGRPEVVLPAVLRFQQDLRDRCSLLLL